MASANDKSEHHNRRATDPKEELQNEVEQNQEQLAAQAPSQQDSPAEEAPVEASNEEGPIHIEDEPQDQRVMHPEVYAEIDAATDAFRNTLEKFYIERGNRPRDFVVTFDFRKQNAA